MWAVIGGSGFEKFEEVKTLEELNRETPFGEASSGLKKVELAGKELLFLPRHGLSHELSPSEVNYQANIFALKKYGAKTIISLSAIGSLQKELKPGDLVVSSQYIDRTKSVRKVSFCGDGVVGHVSLADPVCGEGVEFLKSINEIFDFDCHFGKTHVVIEGPYFSTRAESNMYRQWGADVIGMTNFPEYALAREAGICYLPCSFVTDYDCFDPSIPHVTVEEVIALMSKNNKKALRVVEKIVTSNTEWCLSCQEGGLRTAIMSATENLSDRQQEIVSCLTA